MIKNKNTSQNNILTEHVSTEYSLAYMYHSSHIHAPCIQTHGVNDWHLPNTTIHSSPDKTSQVVINANESEEQSDADTDVLEAEPELQEPPMYSVVMYNDDYTPMEFVVYVLITEFRHTEEQAVQIMLNIHNQGKGIAGIYVKDIAETKANKVNSLARREGHPLMTQIEPNQS